MYNLQLPHTTSNFLIVAKSMVVMVVIPSCWSWWSYRHVGHGGRGGRGEHGGHSGYGGQDRTKLTLRLDFPGNL